MLRITGVVLGLTLVAGSHSTLEAQGPAPPAAPNCATPEHRQFDFWLGLWDVTAGGKPAGTNRIEADLDGCVLVEQWKSASGGRGSSLNFYDRATKAWYQTWIDDKGGALRLKGGLRDGRMVLQSDALADAKGVVTLQRITWSRQAGGVTQLWESSIDGGKVWSTVFEGLYKKKD